jgi:transposase-like protein
MKFFSPPKCRCGLCGSSNVTFIKTMPNVLRVGAAFVMAAFVADLVRVQWKCMDCGRTFDSYSWE